MILEKLVISDTNILLDLISVDMLEVFFSLPCDFSTTDFVISEIIQPVQIKAIEKYIKSKKLDIVSFSFEEIIEITDIHSNNTNNDFFQCQSELLGFSSKVKKKVMLNEIPHIF